MPITKEELAAELAEIQARGGGMKIEDLENALAKTFEDRQAEIYILRNFDSEMFASMLESTKQIPYICFVCVFPINHALSLIFDRKNNSVIVSNSDPSNDISIKTPGSDALKKRIKNIFGEGIKIENSFAKRPYPFQEHDWDCGVYTFLNTLFVINELSTCGELKVIDEKSLPLTKEQILDHASNIIKLARGGVVAKPGLGVQDASIDAISERLSKLTIGD